jgi:hypothetical protein
MPCYQIRTVSIEFHVGNIDLLKKALEAAGMQKIIIMTGRHSTQEKIVFNDQKGILYNINLETGKLLSQASSYDEKQLGVFANSIKRAYSEQVIDELAKKQRWIKRNMGQGNFQLQRF